MTERIDLDIADLKAALDELTLDLKRKIIIGALKDAARPIAKAAKAAAPVLQKPDPRRTPGLVRSMIGVAVSKIFKGDQGVIGVMIRVKPNKGRRVKGTRLRVKALQQDPFYWKFLELGTKKMTKRPFLVPAAAAHYRESIEIIQRRLAERIKKANERK